MEEKKKTCVTCKHETLPSGIEPCCSCVFKSKWEPKDGDMVTEFDPGAPEVKSMETKVIGTLSEEQKEALTTACYDFAMRVLTGKETTPQETATLPEVLNFLRASNTGPYFNFGPSAGNE